MPPKKNALPTRTGGPSATWNHRQLYDRVKTALFALPAHFKSSLDITGVRATDLFSFNSALGAAIEDQVVEALNQMRTVWDPDLKYQLYSFVRQPQTFPDVRLQTLVPNHGEPVLLGIELKGWFAISKEGEPSFRYLVTPDACTAQDFLVVVPWIYKNVISGSPGLLTPFVEEARFAAEMRNYHWQFERGDGSHMAGVELAKHKQPYPTKKDPSSDKARSDGGGNFGRVARTNIMKAFVDDVMQQRAAGIPIFAWQKFLKAFSEGADIQSIDRVLERLDRSSSEERELSQAERDHIADYFEAIARRVRSLS